MAADFREACITAWGELSAAGADVPSITVFAHPTVIASEWSRVNGNGTPIHDDAPSGELTLGPGIRTLGVPMLNVADVLAVDTSLVFRVVRSDFRVDLSPDAGFTRDAVVLRVRGRVTTAAPDPQKSLRKCRIEGEPAPEAQAAARSQPSATSAKRV